VRDIHKQLPAYRPLELIYYKRIFVLETFQIITNILIGVFVAFELFIIIDEPLNQDTGANIQKLSSYQRVHLCQNNGIRSNHSRLTDPLY
jgi:hypothetical protein